MEDPVREQIIQLFVLESCASPISVRSNHGEQQLMGNTFAQLIRHSYVRSGPGLRPRFRSARLHLLIPQSADASPQSLAPETLETLTATRSSTSSNKRS